MKYKTIEPQLFVSNRANFCNLLQDNALAIFHSNEEFTRSGDQNYPFKQQADVFYLSGIDQEQSILLLYPNCPNPLYREVLFLRQTNDYLRVWEGNKLTKEQAQEISGIKSVHWVADFNHILSQIITHTKLVYLNTTENTSKDQLLNYRDEQYGTQLREQYPLHKFEKAAPLMRQLRAIKSETEVKLIHKACSITKDAFVRVLNFMKPNVMEYEIEAEIIHEFIRQTATGHAYTPIIAAGNNANILHYNDNNQRCKSGDLVLMDFGAEYANYNADLSRTIPVSGKFTKRQKEVYTAVLKVMKAAKKLMVSGTQWKDYHQEVGELMTAQLIALKLLTLKEVKNQSTDYPAYKKYFMHGISHHLGLDVHDLADRHAPFAAGNILTCEPGIYIPAEGLGIRLENDILITSDGNIDLMANIPIEIDEIEVIMNP